MLFVGEAKGCRRQFVGSTTSPDVHSRKLAVRTSRKPDGECHAGNILIPPTIASTSALRYTSHSRGCTARVKRQSHVATMQYNRLRENTISSPLQSRQTHSLESQKPRQGFHCVPPRIVRHLEPFREIVLRWLVYELRSNLFDSSYRCLRAAAFLRYITRLEYHESPHATGCPTKSAHQHGAVESTVPRYSPTR